MNQFFNPQMQGYQNRKSPDQLMAELQQTLQQYQNATGAYQMATGQTPVPAGRRSGEYIEVADYQEMENASIRLDGVATLFVDFKNGIFWAKTYRNGTHSVQAYHFEPILTASPMEPEPTVDYTKELQQDTTNYDERLTHIESMLSTLLTTKEATNGTKRSNQHDERNSESAASAGTSA